MNAQGKANASDDASADAPDGGNSSGSSTPSFMQTRAELEQARLARISQRQGHLAHQRSSSVQAAGESSSESDNDEEEDGEPQQSGWPKVPTFYWEASILPTATHDHINKPSVSLNDLVGEKSPSFCLVISPRVDYAWLLSYLSDSLPVVFVTDPPRSEAGQLENGEASVGFVSRHWVRCNPGLNGHGKMNVNAVLFFYTDRFRVVISTGQLLEEQWMLLENTVWVQDFPRNPATSSISPRGKSFHDTLLALLARLNIQPALQSLILNEQDSIEPLPFTSLDDLLAPYDFSKVHNILIVSMPGRFEGWTDVLGVGHTGLMNATRSIGAQCPGGKSLLLEYQTCLIPAKITPQWLREFQISSEGGEGHQAWLKSPLKTRRSVRYPTAENMKILYPTTQAMSSFAGRHLRPFYADLTSVSSLRPLLHGIGSKQRSSLNHSNVIIGTFKSEQALGNGANSQAKTSLASDPTVGGWYYMGSHAISPAAWGEWLPTGSWFSPILNIKNFELGVVSPLPIADTSLKADAIAPYHRPPRPYATGDEPWTGAASLPRVE